MNAPEALDETLVEFPDNRLLIELCGQFDCNLAAFEQGFSVVIMRRGNRLALHGPEDQRVRALAGLEALYQRLEAGRQIEQGDVEAVIRLGVLPEDGAKADATHQLDMFPSGRLEIRTKKRVIEPRSHTQLTYVADLFNRELVFGIGPAGTGKTYLAVAAAVSMFFDQKVDRIILSRPAVEAGERLGFLPGDIKEKIDPYLRPLYDALGDMIPAKQLGKLMEEDKIEVAPLAFMRGRTLSRAFVVLDEAQNCTEMQMKMFLTRMGEGSRMVVTGDPSQVDLPRGTGSGLIEALRVLDGVEEIGFVRFSAADVVRHPMVARIVEAYDAAGNSGGNSFGNAGRNAGR
jgi:phosphate starvation-inducible PhoH-like protein